MKEQKVIHIRDIMKKDFDMIEGMDTIQDALKAMEYKETRCLIVKKRHEHDEYGMLLITDIARKVLANDRSIDRVNVYEVMVKPVISVHPDMDIKYAARLFDNFSLTRAPVVEGGEVVGIVSLIDMVYKGLIKLV